MAEAVDLLRPHLNIELIWASPRELLNIFHADSVGHIITASHALLHKLALIGQGSERPLAPYRENVPPPCRGGRFRAVNRASGMAHGLPNVAPLVGY
jgi:hypothetical protein